MGDEHAGEAIGENAGDNIATISGFCPRFHRAIEIIGRRWTGVIVRALLAGDTRFCQIRTTIPGLSDRLLSERLKELEAEGIVERRVYTGTPVRIEYHLTPKGEALADVVQSASAWAEEWVVPEEAEARRDGHQPAAVHKAS
jgi:DNA-binding HxlR family transcriptional regulator